jgi:hypothetical protein
VAWTIPPRLPPRANSTSATQQATKGCVRKTARKFNPLVFDENHAAADKGAKFWLKVLNELKARGVNDILIAVVDGLKGFPEAITSVFPQTVVQTCIVHLIRNSLAFVAWKERKAILPAIKAIYRAENAPTWRCCGSRNSRPHGVSAIRRSGRCGVGRGSMSFPSSPSHPASAR